MGKTYSSGKKVCRKLSDGSEVCVSEKAWSIFYAWINKHNKDETKSLSMGSDDVIVITPKIYATAKNTYRASKGREKVKVTKLSDEQLQYEHAKYHSEFSTIGDEACKQHFDIANEMIDRGMAHIDRAPCDVVVSLSRYGEEAVTELDEVEMLKNKWKACKSMLFRLSQGIAFERGVFKGLSLDEQKHMVKNLMRKLRRTMLSKGMKPKTKKTSKC